MKHKFPMVISAVLLSAGLLFSAPEVSEENQLSLNDLLSVQLETGSFLELDLKSSPLSMTLIPKTQINNSGARHLSELLEIYVPGFQYMANRWNGYVWGMRGVTGDKNDKIIVLVNGRKMNMQAFHGFAQEYTLGLLGDIERVEVLRGPAGLVYGSGAIAGVVNIVTKKGEDTESFASIKVENNLRNGFYAKNFEGAFYGNPEEDHHLAVHIGMRESEGYGDNVAKQFGVYEMAQPTQNSTGVDDVTGTGRSGTPTAGSPWSTPGNFLASLDYSVNDFRLYVRGTRQVDEMAPFYWPGPWRSDADAEEGSIKYIRNHQYVKGTPTYHHEGWIPSPRTHIRDNILVQGEYSMDVGEDKVVLDAAFMGTTNRLINSAEFGSDEMILYTVGEKHYELGARYLLKSIDKLQLAFGVQYQLYDIGKDMDERNLNWDQTSMFIPEVDYHNVAIFTEGFYEVSDKIGIEAGVRYDEHTRTDGVLSPKAALVYHANDDHTVKFIVQSSSNNGDVLSYELPPGTTETETPWRYENETAAEDADRSALGNIIPPVSQEDLYNLRPEKAISYEIASNHTFDHLSVNTSASYTQLSDLFLYNSILARPVNLGAYDAIALELDIQYNNEDMGLLVGANLGYQAPVDFGNSDLAISLDPIEFTAPAFDTANPVYDRDKQIWVPNPIADSTISTTSDVVANQITADGSNFNSLHTLTTKYYADYALLDYLTFHTDLRLFHGLRGRQVVNAQHEANNDRSINFLGIANNTMAKWNMAFLFNFDDELQVGLYGYDLLSEDDNLHAARWQQMSAPRQAGVFTVDQRTYAIKVTQKF